MCLTEPKEPKRLGGFNPFQAWSHHYAQSTNALELELGTIIVMIGTGNLASGLQFQSGIEFSGKNIFQTTMCGVSSMYHPNISGSVPDFEVVVVPHRTWVDQVSVLGQNLTKAI